MNNKVGKEIIVYGKQHIGKVIAEPTEGFYENTYLVLLNEEGKKLFCGWSQSSTDYEEVKKACGKYGDNPNNKIYFFSKNWSFRFFEGVAKVLTNE